MSARPAPGPLQQFLLCGGVLAPLLFVSVFTVEGLVEPGYNALTGFVSDLSLGNDGWMQVTSFIVCGWLLVGFAVALSCGTEAGTGLTSTPVAVALMGFGLIGAGAFDIDPSWSYLTLHGELHYAFSFLISGALGLLSIIAWHDRRQREPIRARLFLALGISCPCLFALSLLAPAAAMPGLLERAALLAGAAGVAALAHQY